MNISNHLQEVKEISLGSLTDNPDQPRVDLGNLDGLAASIKEHGVMNPITVTEKESGSGFYTIIAGHRRAAACRLAGLAHVSAIVREGDAAILALLENVQRSDLSPIEVARAYRKLLDRGESNQSLAAKLGITPNDISQKLRLLQFPNSINSLIASSKLSEAAAIELLRLAYIDKVATTEAPHKKTFNGSWFYTYATNVTLLSNPDIRSIRTRRILRKIVDEVNAIFYVCRHTFPDELADSEFALSVQGVVDDIKPDFSRLSVAQWDAVKRGAERWFLKHTDNRDAWESLSHIEQPSSQLDEVTAF